MPRLVVICGPANTGKLAAMYLTAANDPAMRVLHRDQVRVSFGRLLSEIDLTRVMAVNASALLHLGYSVVTCGQNETAWDRAIWEGVSQTTGVDIEWGRGLA